MTTDSLIANCYVSNMTQDHSPANGKGTRKMLISTYNIQWGKGRDDVVDLDQRGGVGLDADS